MSGGPPRVDRTASGGRRKRSGYEGALPPHVGEVIVRVEGLQKYFGDLHVLRGIDLEVRQREAVMILGRSGSGRPRSCAASTSSRSRPSGSSRSTAAGRGDPLRSPLAPAPRADPPDPDAHRDAVPGVQPLPAHDGARELHRGADQGQGHAGRPRRSSAPRATSPRSGSATSETSIRRACPAARSSASRSPAPDAWSPRCSSSTSRPRRWTRS
jgi:hypothetical protein